MEGKKYIRIHDISFQISKYSRLDALEPNGLDIIRIPIGAADEL